MIVLDTNVLSELMRASPDAHVLAWIAARPASTLYTTSITQAEVLHGIELLPQGRKKRGYQTAAEGMFAESLRGRVLAFGSAAARAYATIAATRRRAGRPISHFDAQIAAIAHSVMAALATRNVSDFDDCGIKVISPWQA